jgi:hypothetical protein
MLLNHLQVVECNNPQKMGLQVLKAETDADAEQCASETLERLMSLRAAAQV